MFHPVKVLDPKGNIKKVLSSKLLSRRYWDSFFSAQGGTQSAKKNNSRKGRKQDSLQYEDIHFSDSWEFDRTVTKIQIQGYPTSVSNLILHQGLVGSIDRFPGYCGEQIKWFAPHAPFPPPKFFPNKNLIVTLSTNFFISEKLDWGTKVYFALRKGTGGRFFWR